MTQSVIFVVSGALTFGSKDLKPTNILSVCLANESFLSLGQIRSR